MPSAIKYFQRLSLMTIYLTQLQRSQKNSMRYFSRKKHNFHILLINYRAILIFLQLRQIFQLPHSVTLESYVKAFKYKVLNSVVYTNTKLYKWFSEQMIFVVSAKVSLDHWTICFSNALILSSSGTILKSTGAVFQAKRSASPCKMCLSESSLKRLTLYIYSWTIL